MKPLKILLISYAFPPVFSPGAVRMERFAHFLSEFGHEVTVLTCSNAYSSMVTETKTNEKQLGYRTIKTSDLLDKTLFSGTGIPTKPKKNQLKSILKPVLSRLFSFLLFPDRDITWLPTALANIRNQKTQYDVVLGSYPGGTNLILDRKSVV